jgi:peroxiredoxin
MEATMAALQPGTKAPGFSLHTTPDQAVALHEFRGRRLILCFYPSDLTEEHDS